MPSSPERIIIRNAREHNLKGITVELPRRALTVITGPSGSGKSSLAFDTLYAEGQRRYIESLSTYAKQFLERMPKPLVDGIEGISPAVAIEQKNPTTSSRSTVGTATEIYDFLRLLWARVGIPHCVNCGQVVKVDTVQEVVDRLPASEENRGRLADAVATAFNEGEGVALALHNGDRRRFSEHPTCSNCGTPAPALAPILFSFNNPRGACPGCNGFGAVLAQYQLARTCPACRGARLKPEALAVRVAGKSIAAVAALTAAALRDWVAQLELPSSAQTIAVHILAELSARLSFVNDVGLGYLTLDRLTRTLSGGEAQRIALSNALGSHLVDTLYVLDEPSIGLHPSDIDRLLGLLRRLASGGNTVVVVEHDPAAMRAADWMVELGPASGAAGGQLVYQGPALAVREAGTLTGQYLSGEKSIGVPSARRPAP